jgi:hypothetical protein
MSLNGTSVPNGKVNWREKFVGLKIYVYMNIFLETYGYSPLTKLETGHYYFVSTLVSCKKQFLIEYRMKLASNNRGVG